MFLKAHQVQRKVEGILALPKLLFLTSRGGLHHYKSHQSAFFSALVDDPKKTIVIDSSKTAWRNAWRPLALYKSGFEVKVVHLVRDGRGVMWSMMRGDNVKIERSEKNVTLPWARFRAMLGWNLANICTWIQVLILPRGTVEVVRYDDLVNNLGGVLKRISDQTGVDFGRPLMLFEKGERIKAGHQLGGNRMRLNGIDKLRPDDEWKRKLPKFSRCLYWIFCGITHLIFLRK